MTAKEERELIRDTTRRAIKAYLARFEVHQVKLREIGDQTYLATNNGDYHVLFRKVS